MTTFGCLFWKKWMLCVGCCLISVAGTAQTQSIATLSCKFTQEKEVTLLSEKGTSEGVLYFRNGTESALCWKYTSPSVYGFIKDGAQMYLIGANGQKEPMPQENRLFQMIGSLIEQAVLAPNNSVAPQGFRAEEQQMDNGSVRVTLVPERRDLKKLISNVVISFDTDRRIARKVVMNEVSGDRTTLSFKDIKIDQPLDPDVFK